MAYVYCDPTTGKVNKIFSEQDLASTDVEIEITNSHPMVQPGVSWDEWALNASADGVEHSLTLVKIKRIKELSTDVSNYIGSKYLLPQQVTLVALLSEANANSLSNRKNYITPGIAWVRSVLQHFYSLRDQILALNTIADIKSFSWDFSSFDATDPVLTVEQATSISD